MQIMKKIIATFVAIALTVTAFPLTALKVNASSVGEAVAVEYPTIAVNEEKTASADGENYFKFTPSESGYYLFYSYDIGDLDSYAKLYDSEMNEMAYDDDDDYSWNFDLTRYLVAGNTYYYFTRTHSYSDGQTYKVKIEKLNTEVTAQIRYGEAITTSVGDCICLYDGFVDFIPENIGNEDYNFTSSNPAVAEIDGEFVRFNSAGEAVITLTTESGLTDSIAVTVTEPEEITLSQQKTTTISSTMLAKTYKLDVEYGEAYRIYFDADEYSTVYTEDENGLFHGEASGYTDSFVVYPSTDTTICYILVRYYGSLHGSPAEEDYDITVRVEQLVPATSIEIVGGESITGYVGDEFYLEYKLGPENAKNENVYWDSDNDAVTELTSYGYIRFISEGTATITVTGANGITDSIIVNVVAPKELSLGQEETNTLAPGKTSHKYTFTPEKDGRYIITVDGATDRHEIHIEGSYSFGYGELVSKLYAGETYNIWVSYYNDEEISQSYDFSVVINEEVFEELVLDEEQTVDTKQIFSFTPSESGYYSFYSYEDEGEELYLDTYGVLYDSDFYSLRSNDSNGENGHFKIEYYLEAGQTYYFEAKMYYDDEEASFKVMLEKLVPATSVEITYGDAITTYVGDRIYIQDKAELYPENSVQEEFSWTSNNPSVATIDEDGWVDFVSAGTVTFTVTSENGLTDNLVVTVNEPIEISLDDEKTSTISSSVISGVYKFTPDETATYKVYFYADERTYNRIYDENGERVSYGMTGYDTDIEVELEAGETYYIVSKYDNEFDALVETPYQYTIRIEKRFAATSLELSEENLTLYKGINNYYYLDYNFYPEGAIYEDITWTSSNTSVVTVNSWGDIYVVSAGTATITATSENGLTDSAVVTVKEAETLSLGVEKTGVMGTDGMGTPFIFVPEEEGTYIVTINSGDHYIYTTLEGEGWGHSTSGDEIKHQIKAGEFCYLVFSHNEDEYPDSSYEYTVSIKKAEPATSIEIDCNSTMGFAGTSEWIGVNFLPEDSAYEDYTWSSSNPAIATVEEYSLYFVSAGTATITVTSESGLTDSITVTVKTPTPISLDEETTVDTAEVFKFTPAESGYYSFYSYDNIYLDTYAELYDSEFNEIASDDEGAKYYNNFKLTHYLEGGSTYYFKARTYFADEQGEYNVKLVKLVPPTSFKLVDDNGNESILGYVGGETWIYPEFYPENAFEEGVSFTSSNPDVVMVYTEGESDGVYGSEGFVHFRSAGTATITATSKNGLTDSITVTVKAPQVIVAETEYTITVDSDYVENAYEFTPTVSGRYEIFCSGGYYSVYDQNGDYIFGIASGSSADSWRANAGETYTIFAKFEEYEYGDYTFGIEKLIAPTDIEIVSLPDRNEIIESYVHYDFTGLKVKVTFDDSSVAYWTYGKGWEGNNHGFIVDVSHHFTNGIYKETVVSCGGIEESFKLTQIENPVESIEVVSGKITCLENAYGHDLGDYYEYDYYVPDDTKVKINYKDGTWVIADIRSLVDGYEFDWYHDQEENPWTVGDNNGLIVEYLGVTARIPVTVVANPVSSITINSAPTRQYVYGDYTYGWLDGYGYDLYPYDMSGLSFTVYYKDGTHKTFTDADIDDKDLINGYACYTYTYGYAQIGKNTITFEYMGKTATYDVTVIESPVASVEIVETPEGFGYDEFFSPSFYGVKFKINYTNGTHEYVTVTRSNTDHYFSGATGDAMYEVDVNGNILYIATYMFSEDSLYGVSYLGKNCDIIVDYVEGKEISDVKLENVTSTGEQMLIKVTYADGSSETLYFSECGYTASLDSWFVMGCGLTQKGMLNFSIATEFDEYGNIERYYVFILGREIVVEANLEGWVAEGDKWTYYVDGEKVSGLWTEIDGYWYYFDFSGYMVTSKWEEDAQGRCYLTASGKMAANCWLMVDGYWYYFDEAGHVVTNKWMQDSKGWVYLNASGKMIKSDWIQDGGAWYYVDANGYMVTNKWMQDSKGWCYLGSNGKMVKSSWIEDGGAWYYINANGYMVTNTWMKDSKGWVYLGSNGKMIKSSWIQDGGAWYYLNGAGYMVSNQWMQDSKGWCYLTASGKMATNAWIRDSKGWCYVGASGYCVTNCWMKDSKGWVYLNSEGRMATNCWMRDSKGWCYLGADGYAVTNSWKRDSKGWCYLDANGRMVIGDWLYVGGKWYYLDGNGYMVTGTKTIGGKTYKFNSNGVWIG